MMVHDRQLNSGACMSMGKQTCLGATNGYASYSEISKECKAHAQTNVKRIWNCQFTLDILFAIIEQWLHCAAARVPPVHRPAFQSAARCSSTLSQFAKAYAPPPAQCKDINRIGENALDCDDVTRRSSKWLT
jgi:hypothetical protein